MNAIFSKRKQCDLFPKQNYDKMSAIQSINARSRISKYVGLLPFNITSKGSVEISIFWSIWSLIPFALLTAGVIWTSYVESRVDYIDSKDKQHIKEIIFVTVIISSKNIIVIAFLALHLVWLFRNYKKLESAFKYLMEIEGKLPKMESSWQQAVTYGIVLICIFSELHPDGYTPYIITYTLVNMVPSGLVFAALHQFTELLQICRYHFRKISSTFEEVKLTLEMLTPESRKSALLEQCKKNNDLIGCCEKLNYCYGPLLLITVINCFAEISSSLFIIHYYWDFLYNQTFFICMWMLMFLCLLRYLLASCEKTVDMANEFYDNLAETLLNCNDLSNEPCFTVSLLSRKTLNFSAFGYFTIDYGLFFSIIAASITYFLVFIEFNSLSSVSKAHLNATIYVDQ
ncbi:hypothetical protein O3M35_008034 [Rhynocoris fuscipes]|uniref:Gustatory receptor n=1 Tax=Rhynocoris fuscipes TaxID=488301 RepID=A0AAW1D4X8_9HEMI